MRGTSGVGWGGVGRWIKLMEILPDSVIVACDCRAHLKEFGEAVGAFIFYYDILRVQTGHWMRQYAFINHVSLV